ncbi:unnamed protein product [Caenorhabditis auriculariae]|uniref:Uncharacterized protein n=1 Tax=Caenorhabditis auriculariae TaxID=2777116 RepID=A0A8S1HYH0_9PELO|nr:unnamed protein product [Caenorhabditis auriculariae]
MIGQSIDSKTDGFLTPSLEEELTEPSLALIEASRANLASGGIEMAEKNQNDPALTSGGRDTSPLIDLNQGTENAVKLKTISLSRVAQEIRRRQFKMVDRQGFTPSFTKSRFSIKDFCSDFTEWRKKITSYERLPR